VETIMKAKTFLAVSIATAALSAYAGEDSTDRSGIGGTGPAFYATSCGLRGFTGPGEQPSCAKDTSVARDMAPAEMRAWMETHMKEMDEMMSQMKAEHRAMTGATGGRPANGTGAGH